jgi:uncharacterized membrane protein/protein-disulfide isomerase
MRGLTLGGWSIPRLLSALTGAGMVAGGVLATQHWFAARYPATLAAATVCDATPLLRCDDAVLSAVGSIAGVPLGWFGVLLGAFVVLGAIVPSLRLERTNRGIAVLNGLAVLVLFLFSVVVLRSLCLACTIYGAFSLLNAALFLQWRDGEPGIRFFPAPAHLAIAAAVAVTGGWSIGHYHDVVRSANDSTVSMRAVTHFYSLPKVAWPSEISLYRSISGAADFDAVPIRIVEYADPLCIDCQVFYAQVKQLATEFPGRINLAFQFFPLEARCNDVVAKDKNPGSCDLAYMMAYDPARFPSLHDEIYDNMQAAKSRAWQLDFARRHGLEPALEDAALQERVHRLIRTGAEYEKTSEKWAHGIRSTPTLILNNRMIIGTLPLEHLRAIFRALIDEHEHGGAKYMENWIDSGCVIDPEGGPPKPCGGN